MRRKHFTLSITMISLIQTEYHGVAFFLLQNRLNLCKERLQSCFVLTFYIILPIITFCTMSFLISQCLFSDVPSHAFTVRSLQLSDHRYGVTSGGS